MWRSSSKSSAGCGRGADCPPLVWLCQNLGCAWSPVSPAMGALRLGQNIQVHRACAAAEPGLSLLCPVPILSPTRISKVLPAICISGGLTPSCEGTKEVRTRAKSHILEREPLLCTRVSVLLTGAVSVLAPSSLRKLPLQLLTSKSLLPSLWVVGMYDHAYQEFTLFEIKNPDLTLQLQVAADSINNLFHKYFSFPGL